jgi:hypothetical protein
MSDTQTGFSPGSTTPPGPVLANLTPTFSWPALPGAEGYQVTGFGPPPAPGSPPTVFGFNTGASATSYTLPPGVLKPGQYYHYQVSVTVPTLPRERQYSDFLYFQTPGVPPTPLSPGSLAQPGPPLQSASVTFTWSPIPAVTGYQIIVDDTTSKALKAFTAGAGATSYSLPPGALTLGDAFFWEVRGLMGSTVGPVSNPLFFQLPPLVAPTALSPGTPTQPGPVLSPAPLTFTWAALPGATGYQVIVYQEYADGVFPVVRSTVDASATSFTPPVGALSAGVPSYWIVEGLKGKVAGMASVPLFFRTPAVAGVAAISPGVSTTGELEFAPRLATTTPTFTWTAAPGVTGYQIVVEDLSLGAIIRFTVGAGVTSYTSPVGALRPFDTIQWEVHGLLGPFAGPNENDLYFELAIPEPTPLSPGSLTGPGPLLATTTPTFTWAPVPFVTGYAFGLYDFTARNTFSVAVGPSTTSYTPARGVLPRHHQFGWVVQGLLGNSFVTSVGDAKYALYFTT